MKNPTEALYRYPKDGEIAQSMVKDVLDAFVIETRHWLVRFVKGTIWWMG